MIHDNCDYFGKMVVISEMVTSYLNNKLFPFPKSILYLTSGRQNQPLLVLMSL